MTSTRTDQETGFNEYAGDYDALLARGLRFSGEPKEHFAHERLRFLAGCVQELGHRVTRVLDYGCGTGWAAPLIVKHLGPAELVGYDSSSESIRIARKAALTAPEPTVRFEHHYSAAGTGFDLAYCNGVLHHVPPADRPAEVERIFRVLRPGGLFALWENNPWNPGTRFIMSRIAFDHDASPLSVRRARALLELAGFEIIRADFLFIFPRPLAVLRGIEPLLRKLPLGGQYQLLARRPVAAGHAA
jgi:SAM-dependent methyltransferase